MASILLSKSLTTTKSKIISLKTLTCLISSSLPIYQNTNVQEQVSPLPPNPRTGSPFYSDNWRNLNPIPVSDQSLVLVGPSSTRMMAFSQTLDSKSLMDVFADWMTAQRWVDLKQLFELWVKNLNASGKPNRPDVDLYNVYLRANLMLDAAPADLLDLVAEMEVYGIKPNAASYNLVLKGMFNADERVAAEKLIERMKDTGVMPDDESYNLVIGLLIKTNQLDSALKFTDSMLKSGHMLSSSAFMDCARRCVNSGRLDTLASIIEKCKKTDHNKALSPPWALCNYIADIALQVDNSKLTFYALEFLYRWIARGENARPAVHLSVDEGLILSALCTAGRTYNSMLVDASWSILRRSLRQKRAPNPETYLAKIYAYSSLGNLQRAFATLNELETVYANSEEINKDLLSPFTSLNPLVVACCRDGFSSLDSVYVQLENLSRADTPFKSVAAFNCVILGCANIWDLDRAYETFQAIEEKIGLTPDVHSYNSLMCAFGKLKKRTEVVAVLGHMVSKNVKPNTTTYGLLVEAHLVNGDPKSAISALDQMIEAGFIPSKETLRKVRRRCSRELDFDSDEKVQIFAKMFGYRMGTEVRREMLYDLQYSTEY